MADALDGGAPMSGDVCTGCDGTGWDGDVCTRCDGTGWDRDAEPTEVQR
jgi:hypothetical protein